MSIFMLIFFHFPLAFLVIPWVVGLPIMAAGMYPMACIFLTVVICIFVRPVFN